VSQKFNWKAAILKDGTVGWQTLNGGWSSKEHPFLDTPMRKGHRRYSLDAPMFFWPEGIIRYRYLRGTESFFEFCRQDADKFVGPFPTMQRAQLAFEDPEQGDYNG
jgi:hypothetical protein